MDKKRLLQELGVMLGTDEPAVDLTTLSDKKLLDLYEREVSGEAKKEREQAADHITDPLFSYLNDLTDEELLAEYAQAQEAEARGRETATPEPVVAPEPVVVTEPPVEPHAVVLEEPALATLEPPPRPGAHVSEPVVGCACMLCLTHRALARREAEDRLLAARYEHEPLIDDSVRVGPNASPELRTALRGQQR